MVQFSPDSINAEGCYTCSEDPEHENYPEDECPESLFPCGHHDNCLWYQDVCHWCGYEHDACPLCGEITDPEWFCSEGYCPGCCERMDEG